MGSGLEPVIFRFPDLSKQEAGALLIWPPRLVYGIEQSGHSVGAKRGLVAAILVLPKKGVENK